ncbi:menaquinone-dependent protoporphyrinogen IX dehydrogenase [Shewanella sp. D64]|uniref:menaquinone-dependent protoporphyrinogen IX dehydrogenase n=1 Tax=unclassified Shewanella TaxID=196818 RepID=UPI0022BA3FEA|nr:MULTISPECIES: menaquinone-dependent protoporphyrinogen IX dehydrogenase [unclassified Shewanella]MEC4727132.1 menaquinone-dependent protoporphyrinogen IX dehydrogenase [Shewanella sp. D64]MEC4739251.1 menaquinone-dependent protoporphyrinogen IX dehydrogenase [Shewanella sp. E94]WBJ95590.1 menaquinone-dependent protoporphyrinogen IX dehydrogenase [Shewanella sp. MTB7]
MNKTLIIYSTVDGQTRAICEFMKGINQTAESEVTVASLEEAKELSLAGFDKIMIGASIRYGKHRPELYQYINHHHAVLRAKQNAFFTVNVVARKPEKNTAETNPYMKKFLELSLWKPQQLGVFAGKIDYPKYRFFDKSMIRFIMWMTKGPTDTSGTFEFTDWQQVEDFGKAFADR